MTMSLLIMLIIAATFATTIMTYHTTTITLPIGIVIIVSRSLTALAIKCSPRIQ